MSEPLVTVTALTKNEAHNLRECLASVEGLADEVVVVDTGSSDGTPALARELGARVFSFPWTNDFSAARNFALEQARGAWTLTLDADERIVNTDFAETRARLAEKRVPNVALVRMELLYPNDKVLRMLAPRLVRRSSGIRYVFPVHEQLDVTDEAAALSNVTIRHLGYARADVMDVKERRNLALAERMGDEPHGLHCVMRASFSLKDWARAAAAAEALVDSPKAPPNLREEAAAMGAAAAFNLKDDGRMAKLITGGEAVFDDSPDVRLMAAVRALRRYVEALEQIPDDPGRTFIRPTVFWHDKAVAERLMAFIRHGAEPAGLAPTPAEPVITAERVQPEGPRRASC